VEKLQPLREKMQRLLARVLPEQRLSKEDFEQQQASLRGRQAKVSAEIDRVVADKWQTREPSASDWRNC
jgi:hypothetical protein